LDTGAYSKARKRLPLSVIQRLLAQTAQTLSVQISDEQRWCGRRVCAYDGTTVTVRYRQPAGLSSARQSEAVWLSVAKLVVLFCVTTGAVLEVSIAAFKVSEWEMSRQLYVSNRRMWLQILPTAPTYLVLVQAAKADAVFQHHARHCDFRRGKS